MTGRPAFNSLLLLLTVSAIILTGPAAARGQGATPHDEVHVAPTEGSAIDEATAATAEEAVAADNQESGHLDRLVTNFVTLLGNRWADMGWFSARCLFNSIVWSVALLLLGLILAICTWLLLRRRQLLQAPWRWYRYAGWIWLPLIMLSFTIGLAGAGVWVGLERQLDHEIQEQRLLDTIIGDLILAIAMDSAEYQLTGEESAEQLQAVFADSETVADLAMADVRLMLKDLAAEEYPVLQYVGMLLGDEKLQQSLVEATKVDPRLLVLIFASSNLDEYMQQHPQAHPAVMVMALHFEKFRMGACKLVESFTRPLIWMWAGIGLALPMIMMGLLRLAVYLTRPKNHPPGQPLPAG